MRQNPRHLEGGSNDAPDIRKEAQMRRERRMNCCCRCSSCSGVRFAHRGRKRHARHAVGISGRQHRPPRAGWGPARARQIGERRRLRREAIRRRRPHPESHALFQAGPCCRRTRRRATSGWPTYGRSDEDRQPTRSRSAAGRTNGCSTGTGRQVHRRLRRGLRRKHVPPDVEDGVHPRRAHVSVDRQDHLPERPL